MTIASQQHRTARAHHLLPGGRTARGRSAWSAAATFLAGLGLLALGLTGRGQLPGLHVMQDAPSSWFVVPLLVGCLAMVVKKDMPLAALLVGVAAFGADLILGGSLAAFLYFIDLLYHAALLGSPRVRRALWIAAGVLVAVPAGITLLVTREASWGVLMALQQAVLYVGPLWWARDVRTGTELAAVAAARADAIERLAASEQREAVRAERDALARDLHDAVASHLSAIALHSGGALATPAHPTKDRAALELTRRAALESMQEIHALITLLRTPEPAAARGGAARVPGLHDIGDLAEQARRSGCAVELAGLERSAEYPAPLGLAGYRIVQESLTNAVKHAPGESIQITITPSDSCVSLRIRNMRATDTEVPPAADSPGAGFGLTSMRERAVSLGGTLHIEAEPGTWTVQADLPLTRAHSS